MRYYKIIKNGYITLVGMGPGGEEISEAEYESILSAVKNKPTAEQGQGYRLGEDLEWELFALSETAVKESKTEEGDV